MHAYMYVFECTITCILGPPTPQFDYCISYNDGQPTLQVISHVCNTLNVTLMAEESRIECIAIWLHIFTVLDKSF